MKSPFRVKFCGFVNAENAVAAATAGADAIGLNFFSSSPRSVSIQSAAKIIQAIKNRDEEARRTTKIVGLFVNAPIQFIKETICECDLDFIQLHGDETPEQYESHQLLPLIKAVRYRGSEDDAAIERWVETREETGLVAFLVDAHDPVQRGGTGKQIRWDLLTHRPSCFGVVPLILAGGLNPSNIARAIQLARPDAVDAASGIESAKGVKSPTLMNQFIDAFRKTDLGQA